MAGSRKDKRLKDLEYNVYNGSSDSDNGGQFNNSGCLTLIAGIVITFIVCFVIAGAFQMSKNGPSLTCAYTGCSNKIKAGSTYCWLHSSKNTKVRKPSTQTGGSSSSDKNASATERPDYSQKRKIYSGVGDKSNDSKNNSDKSNDTKTSAD